MGTPKHVYPPKTQVNENCKKSLWYLGLNYQSMTCSIISMSILLYKLDFMNSWAFTQ